MAEYIFDFDSEELTNNDEKHTYKLRSVKELVRCKECRHRDPEDHKCDCGQLERAGCIFPVDDEYFCKYGEKKE